MSKLFGGSLEAFVDRARPKCVITGCGLVSGPAWCWGDLHEFGGLWIFHGASHATDWLSFDSGVREPTERALVLEPEATFFVRRGVFVIAKTGSQLNERALSYLNQGRK